MRQRRKPRHSAHRAPLAHSGIRGRIEAFRKLSKPRKILVLSLCGLLALVVIAIITTALFAATLGSKDSIMNRSQTGVTLLDRNGKVFYSFYNARSDTYVPLGQIAPIAQKALISAEDKDFYKHPGFSLSGIFGATLSNVVSGGKAGGGSTLTQQLVKNSLLSQDRNLLRKYQEVVLSVEIERRYSKDEILEMYMNSVYFGEGAFGIEDAAKTYFGKSAKDLDTAQAALLVGIIPAPSAYSPITGNPVYAGQRQSYVLKRMVEDGVITQAQADAAKAQVLSYQSASNAETVDAPHFALMVKEQLEKKYGEEKIARSGYKVTTTIDLDWQKKAQDAVTSQVGKLAKSKVTNGAAVIMDPKTGEVRALVGSADWSNTTFGKVNMATSARQPGSSFKPIVYATGVENKDFSAATIFHDVKTDFGGYTPSNYDRKTRGDVTMRRALANSLNIPAVEAMQKVGLNTTLQSAKKFGITTLGDNAQQYGLSMALGSGQVPLIEMTNAYSTFANQGERNDTQIIASIKDKSNRIIYKVTPGATRVISEQTAYIMSSVLSDNTARAETFGSSLTVSSKRPVAVKTGTTENYRDALAIGYTPSLTIGVWIGNNDNTAMSSVAGSSGAAPIWRSLMQQLLANQPVEQFSKPAGIIEQKICRANGAIAEQDGDNTMTEYFRSGTLPTTRCNEKPKEATPPPVETPQPSPTDTNQDQNDGTDTQNDGTDSGGTGTGDTGTGTGTGTGGTGGGTGTGTGGTGTVDTGTGGTILNP